VSVWLAPPGPAHVPGMTAARALIHREPGAAWAVLIDLTGRLVATVPAAVGVAYLVGADPRRVGLIAAGVVVALEALTLYHAAGERDSHEREQQAAKARPRLELIQGGMP